MVVQHNINTGIAMIPEEWIQVESISELNSQKNIIVMECRKGAEHGNVPHFYFGTNHDNTRDITPDEEEHIYAEIAKIYPQITQLLQEEKEADEQYKNTGDIKAWDTAPHLGLFMIPDAGSDIYYREDLGTYEYPAGAYIVRY